MRARVLARALKAARGNRRELLSRILEGITGKLREADIEAQVFGREKSLYSIYRKMLDKRLSFSQVLDVYGFRVLVHDVPTATSPSVRCTRSTSRCRGSSRTTSPFPSRTATSHCTPL
jgi:(p)ppGpp synthase/HD superfamily hydrolase